MKMKWLWIIESVFLGFALTVGAETNYVRPVNTNATFPFKTWETAATNIQDAINKKVSEAN